MSLTGRRIIVTGAASGIGLAVAERFVAEGAAVALLDVDAAGIEAAARCLADGGGTTVAITADVGDPKQVDDATARADAGLGGIDGIVNAAGITLDVPFADTGADDWTRILAVNLVGAAMVCRAALPAMRRAGSGTIVNIASGAGLRPLEGRSAYGASKAGLVMLSRCLALELAADNIRANTICPGAIDTPMLRGPYEGKPDAAAIRAGIEDRYALGRVGTTAEIAATALYLTGDQSSFVTGSALAVDGGRAFH